MPPHKLKRKVTNPSGTSVCPPPQTLYASAVSLPYAHLAEVALEGSIHSLGLAAEYGGCVILRHCQGVAAMHPPIARLVFVDLATSSGRPSRTLLHVCTTHHPVPQHQCQYCFAVITVNTTLELLMLCQYYLFLLANMRTNGGHVLAACDQCLSTW